MEKGFSSVETNTDFTSKPADKKTKAKLRVVKSEKMEAKFSPEYIQDLAEKVSEILDDKSKMSEYAGLAYPIRRDGAIRICLKISKFRELTDKEKELKALIISALSSRGAWASHKQKEIKKMHTVPKGKSFTPAQIQKMLKQSAAKQAEDEDRAGQSWDDSGF